LIVTGKVGIRLATLADLAAIVAIYNQTIAGRMVTADLEPVSVASRLAWFEAHDPDRRPLWVAVDGRVDRPGLANGEAERISGWVSFQDFYGRPAYGATAEISLYVNEADRRQGIGIALLNWAISAAPELGIESILGFVFSHNHPSLRLFDRLGFTTWGHLPRVARLDGVDRDLIIVGRRVIAIDIA
jgi:L-amino acid N-acyltransferase YncA